MIRKMLLVLAAVAAILALSSGTASAQDGYEGPGTTVPGDEIDTVTVVRGETVDIAGEGCLPGEEVVVTWDDGTVMGTFVADEDGSFVTTITVPADSTLGMHMVTATCGTVEQFLNVNVLAETLDNVDDGTLARTGSSSTTPLLGIGAAALVLGGAFLYGARRPRQA